MTADATRNQLSSIEMGREHLPAPELVLNDRNGQVPDEHMSRFERIRHGIGQVVGALAVRHDIVQAIPTNETQLDEVIVLSVTRGVLATGGYSRKAHEIDNIISRRKEALRRTPQGRLMLDKLAELEASRPPGGRTLYPLQPRMPPRH